MTIHLPPHLLRLRAFFVIIFLSFVGSDTTAETALHFESGNTRNTLVELYTSEGCSSCPPADRYLSQLKQNPDLWQRVIPVAFHVDYWDYIGWSDRFAQPQHTQRQQIHKYLSNTESVYTPQFVINGQEWRGFFTRRTAKEGIPLSTEKSGNLSINVIKEAQRFNATFNALPHQDFDQRYQLHVALLGLNLTTDVKRGENRGKSLAHNFVVLQHQAFSPKSAEKELLEFSGKLKLRQGEKEQALAFWLTDQNQRVIQATGGLL